MNNLQGPAIEVKSMDFILGMLENMKPKEASFLQYMQAVRIEMCEKWDFVQGIEMIQANVSNVNNELIKAMKTLDII